MLVDRSAELSQLDRLLVEAHSGSSGVLVLRGDAGIGKTALLDYTAQHAAGFRIIRAVAVESEMELPYAGLHLLCVSLLDFLSRLPPPQRDALVT